VGLFDGLFKNSNSGQVGAIPGGKQKQDGSHDHRTNTGNDRTPAQKEGDKKREKN
jgi:hypothetical protein